MMSTCKLDARYDCLPDLMRGCDLCINNPANGVAELRERCSDLAAKLLAAGELHLADESTIRQLERELSETPWARNSETQEQYLARQRAKAQYLERQLYDERQAHAATRQALAKAEADCGESVGFLMQERQMRAYELGALFDELLHEREAHTATRAKLERLEARIQHCDQGHAYLAASPEYPCQWCHAGDEELAATREQLAEARGLLERNRRDFDLVKAPMWRGHPFTLAIREIDAFLADLDAGPAVNTTGELLALATAALVEHRQEFSILTGETYCRYCWESQGHDSGCILVMLGVEFAHLCGTDGAGVPPKGEDNEAV